jgi:hypothetical protein
VIETATTATYGCVNGECGNGSTTIITEVPVDLISYGCSFSAGWTLIGALMAIGF